VFYPDHFPKTLDELKLTEVYGKLNNYLHAQKDPTNTVEVNLWWSDFDTLLQEADLLLTNLTYPVFGRINLNDKGRDTYRRWKENEIDDDTVISDFRNEFQWVHWKEEE